MMLAAVRVPFAAAFDFGKLLFDTLCWFVPQYHQGGGYAAPKGRLPLPLCML